MPPRSSPTIRTRRLGRVLADYRAAAGYSQSAASRSLGWAPAKLIRLEGGRVARPSARDITAALDLYAVNGPEREATIALAREAHERGWWITYRDVIPGQAYIALEDAAERVLQFHASLIPGIAQTPQYARALFSSPPDEWSDAEIDRRIAARAQRALVLERQHPPTVWLVLGEAAVRQQVGGPDVLRGQLDHLLALAERGRIVVQVWPYSAGAPVGIGGPFVLLEFPDPRDAPVVFIEAGTDGLYLETQEDVAWHREAMGHLQSYALGAPETMSYLHEIRSGL